VIGGFRYPRCVNVTPCSDGGVCKFYYGQHGTEQGLACVCHSADATPCVEASQCGDGDCPYPGEKCQHVRWYHGPDFTREGCYCVDADATCGDGFCSIGACPGDESCRTSSDAGPGFCGCRP
jgi:hypothetical protein